MAQISAGIILGFPVVKALLFDGQSLMQLKLLADIGIILLFFFIGLETNVSVFTRHIKESALVSIFNTSIPLLLGFAVSHYIFGLPALASLVIGISLGVSSQSISLDFLEELKLVKSRIGQLIISAGAVDDVFELLLVSGVVALIKAASTGAAMSSVITHISLFVLNLIAIRYIVIPLLLRVTNEKSKHLLFMSALIVVLLTAGLAEWMGLDALVGALFGGILLRQTLLFGVKKPWEEHQIAHAFHIVSFGFLVPIFFVWIGLNTSLSALNLPLTAAFIAIAFAGTIIGTVIGTRLSGASLKEGLLVGWGVNAKGDTELVIATLALQTGAITLSIFSGLIVMALATTLISPIVFRILVSRHFGLRKALKKGAAKGRP